MAKVFSKEREKELHVELSNGRLMPLEDLVRAYERLVKEAMSEATITKKLKVGEWFFIDRNVIDANIGEIYRKCMKEGTEGKKLWERFEKSNKIADENSDQYPRIIEIYVFERNWEYKTEQEMREMCKEIGKGMVDEIISDLELQMRICNGESVKDLLEKADILPVRVIKLRSGGTGYLGGSTDDGYHNHPPAYLFRGSFNPDFKDYKSVPCAFR